MKPAAIGKVVRPSQESLGAAIAAKGAPQMPPEWQRPMLHWKKGGPPTQQYRKNHPMLTTAAKAPALPVRSTQGVSQAQLGDYLKALRGNPG